MKTYLSLANLSFGSDGSIPPDKMIVATDGDRDIRNGKISQDDADGFLELGVVREITLDEAAKLGAIDLADAKAADEAAAAAAEKAAAARAAEIKAAEEAEKAKAERLRAEQKTTAAAVSLPGSKKEA